MDPNIALDKLREFCRDILDGEDTYNTPQEVAEQFEALDQWLSNGGFLPSEWQPRTDALKGTP